ncbi:hypothetical protein HRbin23_00911 [bacterium HR23]|nr:hypothetical protein HRbin23_00911 [bacterium HR23]
MGKAILALFALLLVVGAAVVYRVGPWRAPGGTSPTPPVPLFPTPIPTATPTPTPIPTPTPTPSPRPGVPPTPTSIPPRLEVRIVQVTGSGLARIVTAQVLNTGGSEATGVYAVAQFFAGATQVQVNGQDALRVEVGRVGAGQRVERTVEVRFSLLDGLRLQRSGGRVVLTVYADQGTWRYEEAFQP